MQCCNVRLGVGDGQPHSGTPVPALPAVGSVSEGALKATQAALEMGKAQTAFFLC